MHPQTPVCPTCGAETEQVFLPKQSQWSIDPVIVYKAHDGSFRFPGDPNSLATKQYDAHGYERIELRSAADVRRFESQMNARELSRAQRRVERLQEGRERREHELRGNLRQAMQSMSPFGRAVARAAMAKNDAKPREYAREIGFHVDVFSNSRSNREESRDAQGRRRRD